MESHKGKQKVLMRIYPVRHRLNLIEIVYCEARRVQNCVELLYEKQMWLWFYTLHMIQTACMRFVHSLTQNWREGIVWTGSPTQGRCCYVVKHAFPAATAVLKHSSTHSQHVPSLLLPENINSPLGRRLVEQICPALVHLFRKSHQLALEMQLCRDQPKSQLFVLPWPKPVMKLHRFEKGLV